MFKVSRSIKSMLRCFHFTGIFRKKVFEYMDNFIKELAKYRIEKAKDDLEASKLLLNNNLYSQFLNRSYYSIFHAVRAVLAFDQFDSKKHSGVIGYFNQHFINRGIFNKKYSKILVSAEKN